MRREDFPILNEKVHGRALVYLDNAATTQKPQVVLDAITEAYSHWNANVHRGVHHLSQVATQKHEEAREKVAQLIHAQSSEEIIFTKGTTDSLNMLARSFGDAMIKEGDEIIVSHLEHHSNIVPWQMLCERKGAVLKVIPLREDLSLDIEAFKGILSEKTRLVSVAHVSNVLGIVNPIEEVIRCAWTVRSRYPIWQWMCSNWIAISWCSVHTRCTVQRVWACCMVRKSGLINCHQQRVGER